MSNATIRRSRTLAAVVAVAAVGMTALAAPAPAAPSTPAGTSAVPADADSTTPTTPTGPTTPPQSPTSPDVVAPTAIVPSPVVPKSPAAVSGTPSTTSSAPSSTVRKAGTVTVEALDYDSNASVPGVVVRIDRVRGSTTVTTPGTVSAPVGEEVVGHVVSTPAPYRLTSPASQTVLIRADGPSRMVFGVIGRPTDRGALELRKVDAVTGVPLSDAMFRIWTCGGVWLGDFGTQADGVGTWSSYAGCYRIRETEAPAGYLLDPSIRQVEMPANAKVVLTVPNVQAGFTAVRNPLVRTPVRSIPAGPTS